MDHSLEKEVVFIEQIRVEYLEQSMCKELLCKFPDNSAFDFDYSRSGIWSPPIPCERRFVPDSVMELECRKLLDGFEKTPKQEKIHRFTMKIKKKVETTATKKRKNINNNKMKNKVSDVSATTNPPMASSSSTSEKGWAKVLRVASKQFKKQKSSSSSLQIKMPLLNMMNFSL